MAELSQNQIDEIVARVTAAVRAEVLSQEGPAVTQGELRIPMRNAKGLHDDVLWAPWTVALPPDMTSMETQRGPETAG